MRSGPLQKAGPTFGQQKKAPASEGGRYKGWMAALPSEDGS